MTEVHDLIVGRPEEYDFTNCQTRVEHWGPYNKTDVIYAMWVAKGNWAEMSRLLGRRRRSVMDYCNAQPDLVELREELREGLVDYVETKQFEAALAGNDAAGRFLLETLGKGRGYTKRAEVTGPDGKPLNGDDPITNMLNRVAGANKRLVTLPKIAGTNDK